MVGMSTCPPYRAFPGRSAGSLAGVEHLFKRLCRLGFAEIVALEAVAFFIQQELELLGGFDAFGGDVQTEFFREGDDGFHQAGVFGVGGDVADKGAVDLDFVQGQALQIGQRGVTGAEVYRALSLFTMN